MNPSAIIEEFNDHQRALGRSASTIEDRTPLLLKFFVWIGEHGITELAEVTSRLMLEYQLHVSQLRNNKGEPYSPAGQNRHVTSVRTLYGYLRVMGQVFNDPTAGMELVRLPKQLPKDILSVAEVERLIEQPDTKTLRGIRDRAVLEVLYSTAMRRGDLLNLDLNDLRPDDKTIFIRQGKYGRDRVVPCGREAWKWIGRYLKDVRPSLVSDPDEQAVFVIERGGTRVGKQAVKGIVDKYAEMTGSDKNVTPHVLRHSAATHLSDGGADIAQIQMLLGHARADTTAVYLHISIRRLKLVHAQCHPREQVEAGETEKVA